MQYSELIDREKERLVGMAVACYGSTVKGVEMKPFGKEGLLFEILLEVSPVEVNEFDVTDDLWAELYDCTALFKGHLFLLYGDKVDIEREDVVESIIYTSEDVSRFALKAKISFTVTRREEA